MANSERRRLDDRKTPARARARSRSVVSGAGLGVDLHGGPVIDPTENVRELFDAGATRQDDLRLAERRLQEEKILRVVTEQKSLRREVRIRASHQKDLDTLEAKRLDAVRSVDQLAVKTEADRSAAAITALANAAATTAETLRSAVNTSAINLATQLDRTVTTITERIAALEKGSYTSQGKQAVADPMMEQLVQEMRNLTSQRAQDAGKHGVSDPALQATLAKLAAQVDANTTRMLTAGGKAAGMSASWGLLVAGVGLVATLLGIAGVIVTLVLFLNRPPQSPVYVSPPATTTTPPPVAR